MGKISVHQPEGLFDYALGEKCCSICKTFKPLGKFLFVRGRNGVSDTRKKPNCMACESRARNERLRKRWRKDKSLRINNYEHSRTSLMNRYGITVQQYHDMEVLQCFRCAMCGKSLEGKSSSTGKAKKLCVDHDHDTGKVRSLLCNRCNTALGVLENATLLASAKAYLEKHGKYIEV